MDNIEKMTLTKFRTYTDEEKVTLLNNYVDEMKELNLKITLNSIAKRYFTFTDVKAGSNQIVWSQKDKKFYFEQQQTENIAQSNEPKIILNEEQQLQLLELLKAQNKEVCNVELIDLDNDNGPKTKTIKLTLTDNTYSKLEKFCKQKRVSKSEAIYVFLEILDQINLDNYFK